MLQCPVCGSKKTKVYDSRIDIDTNTIRRRRICNHNHRFTTYEMPNDTRGGQRAQLGYVLGGVGAQSYSREDVWARLMSCCMPAGCTMIEAQNLIVEAEKLAGTSQEAFTIPQADLIILRALLKHGNYSYFVQYAAARFMLEGVGDIERLQDLCKLGIREIRELENNDFPTTRDAIVQSPFMSAPLTEEPRVFEKEYSVKFKDSADGDDSKREK